jgi:hypothetical protein
MWQFGVEELELSRCGVQYRDAVVEWAWALA